MVVVMGLYSGYTMDCHLEAMSLALHSADSFYVIFPQKIKQNTLCAMLKTGSLARGTITVLLNAIGQSDLPG